MGISVTGAPDLKEVRKVRPRIVEVIGPAGAGKTTLVRELLTHRGRIHQVKFPKPQKLASLPFYMRSGLPLIPRLFNLPRKNSRRLTQREFAWLSILTSWGSVLREEAGRSTEVVLIDQGPVYLFAEFLETGPEFLRCPETDGFWEPLYHQWAETLDLIVWLDAKDAHLIERIRSREKEHLIKTESDEATVDFLGRFRRSYEYVVRRLQACPYGPRVVKFDTGIERPETITTALAQELGWT